MRLGTVSRIGWWAMRHPQIDADVRFDQMERELAHLQAARAADRRELEAFRARIAGQQLHLGLRPES